MARDFSNKVVFITGAAHGQGRAVALAFARAGALVAGFDIARPLAHQAYPLGSRPELESLRDDEIGSFGGRFLPFVGDVRDEAAMAAAVAKTAAACAGLDIVFGNAGVAAYSRSRSVGIIIARSYARSQRVRAVGLRVPAPAGLASALRPGDFCRARAVAPKLD